MWQPLEILSVFNTLTLTKIFWKTKSFFKKPMYRFLVKSIKIETTTCPMLRKIEWEVQNRPITKNWVLPVTTLFSENFVLV